MTVATTGNRFSYVGDGATVAFSFPRLFFADADLRVILRDAVGAETVQTIVTHYTVTGAENPAGGTVTMVTPPAPGQTLVIVRRTAQQQNTDYVTGGAFSADGHEDALDKLTLEVQDLQEQVDRAPKLKETTASATPDIPEPSSLGFLRWNAAATALESVLAATLGAIGITVTADNRLMKSVGTAGDLEETGITVDDSDNLSGVNDLTVGGAFTSTGIDDNATGERLQLGDTDIVLGTTSGDFVLRKANDTGNLILSGGSAFNVGANAIFYSSTHASKANDIELRTGGTLRANWDDSAANWNFGGNNLLGIGSANRGIGTATSVFSGGSGPNLGGNLLTFGETHSTQADDIQFRAGTAVKLHWDASAFRWDFLGTVLHGVDTLRRGSTTSFLGVSGGSSGSLGANAKLYGEGHATQANDIELRSGATIRLAWDNSAGQWKFGGNHLLGVGKLEIDADFHLEIDGASDPRITMDAGDDFFYDRSANQYVFQIGSANVFRLASTAILPDAPLRLKSYTVGTLPTGTSGDNAFASDLRNGAEGAGVGTGGPVCFANSNWRRYEDNAVAAA